MSAENVKGENTTKRFVFIAMLAVILTGCAPGPTEIATPVIISPTAMPIPTELFITFTPSPLPAEPTLLPMMTPDAAQVEHWREYQTELAKAILPMLPVETVLCEWDILARSSQEVYVWAVCASSNGDDMRPAVIHLNSDGSARSVEVLKRGSSTDVVNSLFPEVARQRFDLYAGNSRFSGRVRIMLEHLKYRKTYPEEPPLIVLLATPIATPTP